MPIPTGEPDINSLPPGIRGFYAVLGPKIARRNALEDDFRTSRVQQIYKYIGETPGITPEEVDQMLTEVEKLYSDKGTREIIKSHNDRLRQFHANAQKIASEGASQGTSQSSSQPSSQSAAQPSTQPSTQPYILGADPTAGSTPPPSLLSTSKYTAQPSANPAVQPQEPSPLAKAVARSNPDLKARVDEIKRVFPDIDDATLANMVIGKNVTGTGKMQVLGRYTSQADGKQHIQVRLPDGTLDEIISDAPAQEKVLAPRMGRPISARSAKALNDARVSKGLPPLKDETGTELDWSNLGDDMAVYPVVQGNKQFYLPTSQKQATITVGNIVYAVPEFDKLNLPDGAGVELGMASVPRTTTTEQMAISPTGEPVAQTMYGSSTPVTTGVNGGRSAGTPPITGTQPSMGATPPPSYNVQPEAKPTAKSATEGLPKSVKDSTIVSAVSNISGGDIPTASTPGARPLSGMPASVYNQWIQRITPVREVSNQLFGDPSQPDFVGLKDYAYLADNPESARRIANAVQATMDGVDLEAKAHGSLVNLLTRYSGLPQELINAKTATKQDIIGKLTPEEHAAYAAEMAVYGTMIGLRALTKAGAYEFSTKAIQNEMPVIGSNVKNSKEFYNMMARLAQEIWGGSRIIPQNMITPEEREHYRNQVSEMKRLAGDMGMTRPPSKESGSAGTSTGTNPLDQFWSK